MFKFIGGVVVMGFATYGFALWLAHTYGEHEPIEESAVSD